MSKTHELLRVPTRDEVWPLMPSQVSGPAWSERIDAAIDYWEEYGRFVVDLDAMTHEYAESDTPVYNKDRADRFAALDLWAVEVIEDRALDLDVNELLREHGLIAVLGLYCWLASELVMQAVARAAGADA